MGGLHTDSHSNADYIGFDVKDFNPSIEHNSFDILTGKVAIWTESTGIASETRIVNNMIAMRDSSASVAGIYVNNANTSIYHNTIRSLFGPALVIAGGTEIRIKNNLLINEGGGLSLNIYNTSMITSSDYNDIYSTGNPLVRVNGSSYNSLASYKLSTGLDTNSIEQSVSFVDTIGTNDLHLMAPNNNDIDFLAPGISSVTTDFDGDFRGSPSVYKGADEGVGFDSLDNADTANGYYTVGGTSPDYSTPSAAITALKQLGMKGPVTFQIRAGFYTTHQTISGVNRTGNADDLLLFVAADFNNPPTLRYNTNTALKNWVIKIEDMGDISFDHINFYSSASSIYGNLMVIEGDSDYISVRDGIFTGVTGQTADTAALIHATEQSVDNYEFINNEFNNGSIALNLIPSSVFFSPKGKGLVVESNVFSQQVLHALLTNHDEVAFNGNEVINNLDDFVAVNVQYNRNTQIGKNKFLLTGASSTAINLKSADSATTANPNIISNNFIKSPVGIELNRGSTGIGIYYNNIVSSVLPVNIQGDTYHSDKIKLLNNILLNNGSGATIFVEPDAVIEESNFNNFINVSGTLLDWQGSQYASLSAFQNATSFDSRSSSTMVYFANLTYADFHLVSSSIGNPALTGTPVPLVNDDYDSDARTLASPYMGADQVAGNPIINTYSIGGNISGLASGNTVNLANSNGDVLTNQTNGGFVFPVQPNDGSAYSVSVTLQPTTPNQTCNVTNGSGNISGENVTNIDINCLTNFYSIGGTVSGLTAGNSVSLQNNFADNKVINGNGAYTFASLVENGESYSVTVLSPPNNPRQTCSISNAASVVSDGNVTNINVNCVTDTFSVGGNVSGLAQGNSVELQNNYGDNLIVSGNGGFTFATELDSNSSYSVTVLNQPSTPQQTCQVTNGMGDINTFDIVNVQISCSIDTFTIGGTVTGLDSGNVVSLQGNLNNSGEIKHISDNGSYTFLAQLESGDTYDVIVLTQPHNPIQTCTVSNATGAVATANVTNVDVNCELATFSVGGSVFGLATGNSVELQNNNGDNLIVSDNGGFTFATELDSNSSYAVTVINQPTTPEQECTVSNGTGDINSTDISNVQISCTSDEYAIGGNVSGLLSGNSVVLRNNAGDDLEVSSNASFVFSTMLGDGVNYQVTVFTHPSSPSQNCSVFNGTGTVNEAHVTNVMVTCDNLDLIFANGFESNNKTTNLNQYKITNDGFNSVSGAPVPRIVPVFNLSGIILLIIGLLLTVKMKNSQRQYRLLKD